MAKKSKETKEELIQIMQNDEDLGLYNEPIILSKKIADVNPLTISECCKAEYISSGTKVYCSKCKADCRLERQKKLIKLWSPKA